ncbi:hypothetical protein M407DRAFT_33643 [Tulasnella calospora MUT 4182]|uniref:Uncharacterized protein n=1 Tax=Tulasnella calospora MUT 4182 TaxID=1051891 RepID=A0A0C3Q1Y7_9AGAM|nr:hypothetical protein M407DRAFT_33643 [Tulasnella calospora MUT 4182]
MSTAPVTAPKGGSEGAWQALRLRGGAKLCNSCDDEDKGYDLQPVPRGVIIIYSPTGRRPISAPQLPSLGFSNGQKGKEGGKLLG